MKSIIQPSKSRCFLCGRNGASDPLDAIKKINGILFNRRKQFGVMFERVE